MRAIVAVPMLLLAAPGLSGCAVYDVAGAAVDATTTVAGAAVDATGAVVGGAAHAVSRSAKKN